MISCITLHNYQSHKHSRLLLDRGVNVIVGPSDSGKSAILRGLNWICTNRPQGTSFISNWSDECSVYICIDDEKTIVRKRTKDENSYVVQELNNLRYMTFRSFGSDIPDSISELLNMGDINCQFQMDASFLLSSTSGQVSHYLNEIVNLDIIDAAQSSIEQRKRNTSKKINLLKEHILEIEDDLKEYDDLSEIESLVEFCEYLDEEIKEKKEKIKSLESLIHNYDNLVEKQQSLPDVSYIEKEIKTAYGSLEQVSVLSKNTVELGEIADSIERNMWKIEENKVSIEELNNEYEKIMPEVCPLCQQPIKK